MRVLPYKLQRSLKLKTIDFSIEHLIDTGKLQWHDSYPADDGMYFAWRDKMAPWNGAFMSRFGLSVSNTDVRDYLVPLSRTYPEVYFVNAEGSEDGNIVVALIRDGRMKTWRFPESRSNHHWKATAKRVGIKKLKDAYDDDDVRYEAESDMMNEAVDHFDGQIMIALKNRTREATVCACPLA